MIQLKDEFSQKHILMKARMDMIASVKDGLNQDIDMEVIIEEIIQPYEKKIGTTGLKSLKKIVSELQTRIEKKGEHRMDTIYTIIDHAANLAGVYNSKGNFMYSRALLGDEMNTTIFQMSRKTGTND
jgi:hypothetical protein